MGSPAVKVTLDEVRQRLNDEVGDKHDTNMPYGVPTPIDRPMMLASNLTSLQEWADFAYRKFQDLDGEAVKTCVVNDTNDLAYDRNNWPVIGRQRFVIVKAEAGKDKLFSYHIENSIPFWDERLRFIVRSGATRISAIAVDAELKAQEVLFKRLNEDQKGCYILNSQFVEYSKRSNVAYLLRKGLPTIALSIKTMSSGAKGYRFLAAMCLHPLGYYSRTYVGVMAPSDELLMHLLMIRSDEHMYWRKCNQHPAWQPEAAI